MKTIIKFLFLLVIGSCALSPVIRHYRVSGFELKAELRPGIKIKKACWDEISDTFYLWQENSSMVHIYHQGNRINTIGNEGGAKTGKLTDICLSAEGNLFLLDELERKIIKIDRKGSRLGEFYLPQTSRPRLMSVSSREIIFVYDDSEKTVIIFDAFGRESYRFGEFLLKDPLSLEYGEGKLVVYEKGGRSLFFSETGQFIYEREGRCFFERENLIRFERNYLSLEDGRKFAVEPEGWDSVFWKYPYFILINSEQLRIGAFNYERK